MNNSVQRNVPIQFSKLTNYDDRFMTVKIWLMHLEENYNGSYFSKDVVQKAIPSLANTPILGFIEQTKDDIDFSDHRSVLVKQKDKYQIKYIGQAYGVIPESNNAQFEKKVCDDGIEREFLTVEGLIWDKWDDSINIFNRDEVKGQSMELHERYNGEFEDDKLFHFSDFQFFGACVLGDKVTPAMEGSTIEKYTLASTDFNYKLFMKDISSKVEEFKKLYTNTGNEEGEDMTIANVTNEDDIVATDFVAEDDIVVEDVAIDFSLTASQLQSGLCEEISELVTIDQYGNSYQQFYYVDNLIDQSIVIAFDTEDGSLVGLSYSIAGDSVTIDWTSEKPFKIEYVPSVDLEEESETDFSLVSKELFESLKTNFDEVKSQFTEAQEKISLFEDVEVKFTALEEELVGLREFKVQKDTLDRVTAETELFSMFSEKLSDEEIDSIKTSFADASLSDIEKELYVLVGKKSTFTKAIKPIVAQAQVAPEVVKITVFSENSENTAIGQASYVSSILDTYIKSQAKK